jgi:hypothetical protein
MAHRHADARPDRLALRATESSHSRQPRTSQGAPRNPLARTINVPDTGSVLPVDQSDFEKSRLGPPHAMCNQPNLISGAVAASV